MTNKRTRGSWLEGKTTNAVAVALLRIGAAILLIGSVAIIVRGYIEVGGQKETGWRMYAFVGFAAFWSVVLWKWAARPSKE